MSMYGPPGGPYPGQPQDPWQSGQPQDPYGQQPGQYGQPADPYAQPADPYAQPADPYAQPADPYSQPWGANPSSAPPGVSGPPMGPGGPAMGQAPGAAPYGQQQYSQPGYGAGWSPPPQKKGSGPLIAAIVVLAVLLCGGGISAVYFVARDNKTDKPGARSSTSASAGPSQSESESPSPEPSETEEDDRDLASITIGDCLVNEGTDSDADMRKVTCTSGTYEVLKRFDGTTDKTKCSAVSASTHTFTHTSNVDSSSSFVLCMKQRA